MHYSVPFLLNAQDNEHLNQYGYSVVPFLNKEACEKLIAYYYDAHPQTPDGVYSTSKANDQTWALNISRFITAIFAAPFEQISVNCEGLGCSFIAKKKATEKQKGVLIPHQDWNLTDEKQFASFNVWVPLVDTLPENGGIYVLPGSHQTFNGTFRGPTIPHQFVEVADLLWQAMIPLHIKAGHALFYDHRLIHGSPVNQTDQIRLAAVMGVKQKNAPFYCYHYDKINQQIEFFESNPNFYFSANHAQDLLNLPPKGTLSNAKLPVPFTRQYVANLYGLQIAHNPNNASNITTQQKGWKTWLKFALSKMKSK